MNFTMKRLNTWLHSKKKEETANILFKGWKLSNTLLYLLEEMHGQPTDKWNSKGIITIIHTNLGYRN